VSRFIFTSYEGVFEGMAHRVRIGSLVVRRDQWHLHCWGTGVVIGGSVLRADFDLSTRGRRRTRVEVRSHDGRYQGDLTVRAGRRRVDRRLEAARGAAEEVEGRRELVRHGDWWLDPRAFAQLGPAAAVTVPDARYLGGWEGRVRFERRPGGRMLDLDPKGITLRGLRRHLQIPWDTVRGLAVEGDRGALNRAMLRVATDAGEVRFETHQSTADALSARLAPLTRQIARSATSGDGGRTPGRVG